MLEADLKAILQVFSILSSAAEAVSAVYGTRMRIIKQTGIAGGSVSHVHRHAQRAPPHKLSVRRLHRYYLVVDAAAPFPASAGQISGLKIHHSTHELLAQDIDWPPRWLSAEHANKFSSTCLYPTLRMDRGAATLLSGILHLLLLGELFC